MKIKEVTVSLAKESLSIDCCQTKPKYRLAQQRIRKKEKSQVIDENWSKIQQTAQVAIGFSYESDSLQGRGEFSEPITEWSKEHIMQSRSILKILWLSRSL